MTVKTERAIALLKLVPKDWEAPDPLEEATLLEQGLLCVLTRHLSRKQAAATIKNLEAAFQDWNELRVAQVQEILPHISTRSKNGAGLIVARSVKDYLQEVFQKNHGFDLEFMRENPAEAMKFLADFPYLGAAASHYIVWLAGDRTMPVSPGLVRTLDRLGLVGRTTSMRKALVAIEPLVPKDRTVEFAVGFGAVVERWCDSKKPMCWECPLVEDCPHGKKVYRDWLVQQERLESQRKREEARAEALRKKEEARQKRDEDRRRKEAEKRARKLERERERQQKAEKKRREEEAKRKELHKKKQEADKKAALAAKKKAALAKAAKKKATKKATKKVTKKPAKKATKKATKKVTKKVTKKATKKATKKVAKKPVKKTAKKTTTPKTAKKATKKTSRKKR